MNKMCINCLARTVGKSCPGVEEGEHCLNGEGPVYDNPEEFESVPVRDRILSMIGDSEGLVFLEDDRYDAAIIGVRDSSDGNSVVAYDIHKILDILMKNDGMYYDEAMEYFDFNILGAHMGDRNPVYIDILDPDPDPKEHLEHSDGETAPYWEQARIYFESYAHSDHSPENLSDFLNDMETLNGSWINRT